MRLFLIFLTIVFHSKAYFFACIMTFIGCYFRIAKAWSAETLYAVPSIVKASFTWWMRPSIRELSVSPFSLALPYFILERFSIFFFTYTECPNKFLMRTFSENLKIGLEEIEKLKEDIKWCQKLTLETWNWKVMKNIWSAERILFSKRLDFQAKSQSWKRRRKR